MNITIKLDDSKKYKKSDNTMSYFISFDYSHYLVETLKQLPKRFYHADEKIWEVPASYKDYVDAWVIKVGGAVNGNEKQTVLQPVIKNQNIMNDVDLKAITMPEIDCRIPLFKHQEDVVKYGIAKNSFLLGDEMGLGKTASVIHYALYMRNKYNYKHCLVIAGINGLKWNWLREIEKHSNERGWVLGMKCKKRQANVFQVKSNFDVVEDLNVLPNFYFLIINVEKLRDDSINKRLIKLINDKEINMVIIDECQAIKNHKAKQTKKALELRAQTRIAMTGTPIMNSPLELWPILNWLGVENHNFYEFKNHHAVLGGYMNKQVVGYKNVEEITDKLKTCMLRRLTSEVIDLPERIESYEYLEMNERQWGIYDEIRNELLKKVDKIKLAVNPLTELIRLRQATAWTGLLSSDVSVSAKFERLEQIACELVDNSKKFIVFSNWETVIKEVETLLFQYKPAVITGKKSEAERELSLKRFKEDNDCKCIIGTIDALGTGYTLTEASHVIFLDEPWNSAKKEQAMKRSHRIGTKEVVTITTLICAGTIDERISEIVYKKGLISQAIVDMDTNLLSNMPEIVDYLLN